MKTVNPFDTAISTQKRMPETIRDAAIELTDTLDLCWAAAQAVFEKKATPEHALALLPMFMQRSDEKRRQQEAEALGKTPPSQKPAASRRRKSQGPEAN